MYTTLFPILAQKQMDGPGPLLLLSSMSFLALLWVAFVLRVTSSFLALRSIAFVLRATQKAPGCIYAFCDKKANQRFWPCEWSLEWRANPRARYERGGREPRRAKRERPEALTHYHSLLWLLRLILESVVTLKRIGLCN